MKERWREAWVRTVVIVGVLELLLSACNDLPLETESGRFCTSLANTKNLMIAEFGNVAGNTNVEGNQITVRGCVSPNITEGRVRIVGLQGEGEDWNEAFSYTAGTAEIGPNGEWETMVFDGMQGPYWFEVVNLSGDSVLKCNQRDWPVEAGGEVKVELECVESSGYPIR